jgi:hypothetical protein
MKARSIALVVTGSLATLLAVGLLAGGGLALWGNAQKDSDGYLSTDTHQFEAGTRALATENLDIDLDGGDVIMDTGDLGKVRLQVESRDDKPVFVGIARTSDVDDYLRGVDRSVVTDFDDTPFRADYREEPGSAVPAPPAREQIWDASTQGTGLQTLTWDVRDGDWSVVVMNADGSPGVDAGVSAGAKLGFLDELGWVGIGTGLLVLAGAGGFLYLAVRRPRQRTPEDPNPSAPRSVAPSASTT